MSYDDLIDLLAEARNEIVNLGGGKNIVAQRITHVLQAIRDEEQRSDFRITKVSNDSQ